MKRTEKLLNVKEMSQEILPNIVFISYGGC